MRITVSSTAKGTPHSRGEARRRLRERREIHRTLPVRSSLALLALVAVLVSITGFACEQERVHPAVEYLPIDSLQ